MERKITSHIIKGAVIAAAYMTIDFVIQKKGGEVPIVARYLPMFVLAIGAITSCLVFSRQSGTVLRFGDVFAHGFKTTAVFAFLIAVYTFILIKYVFPPTEKDIQAAMVSLQLQGNVMPAEARKMAEDASKNAWIISVSGALLVCVVAGALGSATGAGIGTAIAKKKP